MRYIIIGAGAIGGAIGGLLAEAGHDVVLVARGAHAAAMREHGLRLGTPDRVIVVNPPVAETVSELELQPDDVLMLCVKSQDSVPLLVELASLPVGDAIAGEVLPLVCAQNGIINEQEALRRFRHVHGMAVMLQASHLEPGVVFATGAPVTGLLELGRYPSGSDDVDAQIAADLNGCGFLVDVHEDVMAWKRGKLVRNLRNAIEAMCGRNLPPEDAAVVASIRSAAMEEGRRVFAAVGYSIVTPEEWDARNNSGLMETKPVEGQSRPGGSTWQSVKRGLGAVETDYLNGEIVLQGRLHGVPTPVNEGLQLAMSRFLQEGRAAGSLAPTDLLQ